MKDFWNQRYREEELAYGEEPNAFVKTQLSLRKPGKVLFPAEGQGRNSLFAASLGWQVDAFDYSEEARNSTIKQAERRGLQIHYQVQNFLEWKSPGELYDLIVLCYVHLKPDWKTVFYPELIKSLRPGGELILEAFTKTQLAAERASGGPKAEDLLFDATIIREDFGDLEEIYLEEMELELNEGKYHVGVADIIRFIGVRR